MLKCLMAIFCLVSVSLIAGCGKKDYTIIEAKCGNCHKSEIVYLKKRSIDEWNRVLYAMQLRGLTISEKEKGEIFDVLKEKKLINN